MNNRDFFLPSLTTIATFTMLVFLSCAHQNRVRDDGETAEAEQTTEATDTSVTESTTEVPGEGSSLESTTETVAQTEEQKDATSLETLSGAEPTAETTNSELAQNDLNSATAPVENLETNTSNIETDPLANLNAETAPPIVAATTDSELSNDSLSSAPAEELAENTPPKFESEVEEPKAPETFAPAAVFSGISKVPKIPRSAVKRNGIALNRFYFVRKNDTAQSVSSLIYGSTDKAKDLKKWNKGSWKAGRLVYYQSPSEPSDSNMGSFYKEKGVNPEEYTIQKGDWLSRIATKKLGSAGSWKEIAVINGFDSPDKLEVGQKIAYYPKDLSGSTPSQTSEVAEGNNVQPNTIAHAPEVEKIAPAPEQTFAQNPTPPQAEVAPPVNNPPPVFENEKKVKEAKTPSIDGSKVIEQNLPAIFLMGGVLLLSIAYLAVRRRQTKKQMMEDNVDDGFVPPSKLKRK